MASPGLAGEGYAARHLQSQTLRHHPNSKLLTDRNAYLTFLEQQLQRVSSACLTSQAFDARISQLDEKTAALDEKLLNFGKLTKLGQEFTEEVHRSHLQLEQRHREDVEQITSKLVDSGISHVDVETLRGSVDGLSRDVQRRLQNAEEKLQKQGEALRSVETAVDAAAPQRILDDVKNVLSEQKRNFVADFDLLCDKLRQELKQEADKSYSSAQLLMANLRQEVAKTGTELYTNTHSQYNTVQERMQRLQDLVQEIAASAGIEMRPEMISSSNSLRRQVAELTRSVGDHVEEMKEMRREHETLRRRVLASHERSNELSVEETQQIQVLNARGEHLENMLQNVKKLATDITEASAKHSRERVTEVLQTVGELEERLLRCEAEQTHFRTSQEQDASLRGDKTESISMILQHVGALSAKVDAIEAENQFLRRRVFELEERTEQETYTRERRSRATPRRRLRPGTVTRAQTPPERPLSDKKESSAQRKSKGRKKESSGKRRMTTQSALPVPAVPEPFVARSAVSSREAPLSELAKAGSQSTAGEVRFHVVPGAGVRTAMSGRDETLWPPKFDSTAPYDLFRPPFVIRHVDELPGMGASRESKEKFEDMCRSSQEYEDADEV